MKQKVAADKAVPVSVFGEIADKEPLMICRPGLVGRLSVMPVVCALRSIRAIRLLYQGILPTPLTGDNAAASVNQRPAAGRRGARRALLVLCLAAVPALMFAGDAIALPFGAFGVVAPQIFAGGLSIPVVGAVLVGAGVVGLAAYGAYELCRESPQKNKEREGQE